MKTTHGSRLAQAPTMRQFVARSERLRRQEEERRQMQVKYADRRQAWQDATCVIVGVLGSILLMVMLFHPGFLSFFFGLLIELAGWVFEG